MAKFHLTKRVEAPVERTFEVFTDFETWKGLTAIVELAVLTDGPMREGAKFRETRIVMKKEATEEFTISGFEPPERYTVTCVSHGTEWVTVFNFKPDGDACDVEMLMTSRTLTLGAKLMTPLMLLMSGTMKKMIDRDLSELKAVVEGRDPATT